MLPFSSPAHCWQTLCEIDAGDGLSKLSAEAGFFVAATLLNPCPVAGKIDLNLLAALEGADMSEFLSDYEDYENDMSILYPDVHFEEDFQEEDPCLDW